MEQNISLLSDFILQIQPSEHGLENALKLMIANYLKLQIAHWQAKNEAWQQKKGMDFLTYQNTMYHEWDGGIVALQDDFFYWENAYHLSLHYQKLEKQWQLLLENLNGKKCLLVF
ncbi:MAG: hypothetical protein EAZ97_09755 [Bacteroidetes bacterium]|nr:MAG: hypothetical protein EAZ97_09755 [Bacteroidota bacterium]